MSFKTFWTILLKIVGLFLISGALIVLPQVISSLYYAYKSVDLRDIIFISVINLALLFIYLIVIRLCIFKTSWIISKLKLDKDFEDERIELSLDATKIFSIAIIVIAGLLFVESLPVLFKQIFVFFQQELLFKDYPQSGWMVFNFVKVVISYIVLTNSFRITKLIEGIKSGN